MKKELVIVLLAAVIASIAPVSPLEAKSDFLPARVISPAAPLFVPGVYRILGDCRPVFCATTFEIVLLEGQLGVRVDQAPVEAVVDGEKITLPTQGIRLEVYKAPFGLGEALVIYADEDFPRGRGRGLSKDSPLGQLGLDK
ncbi:MAG: hypothetical protein HY794_01780 [Desulfarculus sp.]|nr:hypothetical protein [Desulfarculus sp.]